MCLFNHLASDSRKSTLKQEIEQTPLIGCEIQNSVQEIQGFGLGSSRFRVHEKGSTREGDSLILVPDSGSARRSREDSREDSREGEEGEDEKGKEGKTRRGQSGSTRSTRKRTRERERKGRKKKGKGERDSLVFLCSLSGLPALHSIVNHRLPSAPVCPRIRSGRSPPAKGWVRKNNH